MALPAQLRKQTEHVQALYEEMGKPPGAPASTGGTVVELVPSPAEKPDEVATLKKELDDLGQKYRSLQGMYNAEIPRYQGQIKDLTNKLDTVTKELIEARIPGAVPPSSKPKEKLITDKDEQDWGEAIDVMRRAAREEADALYTPVIDELRRKIASVEGMGAQMEGIQRDTQEQKVERFWDDLQDKVPDLFQVNENADFKSWLLTEDPITGTQRQAHLTDAQNSLNSTRVAAIFNEWKRLTAIETPAPAPTPTTTTPTVVDPLQAHIAPGRSKAVTPKLPEEVKPWKRSDISRFYKDVQLGKFKGREADKLTFEREIFAAQANGLVLNE